MTLVAPVAANPAEASHTRSLIITGILVLIVMSMVLPIPAGMLDIGIALSIAGSILILVMASLVSRPTDFQAFPVLLLISLVLRLSLNVSSTRLILTSGHTGPEAAGHVISGFASFVAGGSLLIGLTVFAVISAVNFIVITKGSGRMAEVAARFALDSLPGKQLAIDADLNSGAIDHEEAKHRRAREAAEISFFGSLDGTSKFVKGDAIAGLVIILINLLVGLSVGIIGHAMAPGEALGTYARLTIGDGLVTQIPALITSMAAALLLSRGGSTETTADLLSATMAGNWRAPAIVAGGMAIMSIVPGMPMPVFLGISTALAALSWHALQSARKARTTMAPLPETAEATPSSKIGDALDLDEIAVEIGPDLVASALDEGRGLGPRIANLRLHLARSYGVILPDIRISDAPDLPGGDYVIRVHNVIRGRGNLRPHEVLVLGPPEVLGEIGGEAIREPVYDAPARWIGRDGQTEATLAGGTVVAPMEVLSTHLMEIVRRALPQLMSLGALQRMIAELKELSDHGRAEANRRFFDSMVPDKVAPELLLAVLRLLLREGVSVRNLVQIVDTIAEMRALENAELICERVRHRLRGQITEMLLTPSGRLETVQLDPLWEAEFSRGEAKPGRGSADVASVRIAQRLVEAVSATMAAIDGARPVLAVPDHRRRMIRSMLEAAEIDIPVIGLDEIEPGTPMTVLASIDPP